MTDIYQEMLREALSLLHAQQQRIAALETQMSALRQQYRDLTADMLRYLRKEEPR
jgi:molecular chaperone GrpE (heat shock protein)